MTERSSPVYEYQSPAREYSPQAAQRLRLQRMLWACAPLSVLLLFVASYVYLGWLPLARALEYAALVVLTWACFFSFILSGVNQRLADPSLTIPQILTGIFCQLYIMYFLPEPLLRVPFLLLGTVNMMFAVFAMNLWRMLWLNVVGVSAYAGMILLKAVYYPAGLGVWQAEVLVILAFFISIALNAYIGSVIVGLRDKLRLRNRELHCAMVQLEDLATRDPLTRLPNRRSVMREMTKEESRLERNADGQATLCLCMLDIDDFKRVNDQHGHQAGDDILHWFGDQLSQHLRAQDFVGRFGGEEFLLLLPNTTLPETEALICRLLSIIRSSAPPTLPPGARITASAGVAEHQSGQRLKDTLRQADKALYQAKANGRDRTVAADHPSTT